MPPHPWDTASCPSRFWLLWLWPVLLLGARAPLQEADLYDLPSHLHAVRLDEQQRRSLASQPHDRVSLTRVLLHAFGWRYPIIVLVFSFWLVSLLLVPFFTDKLFAWFGSEDGISTGLGLSLALVASYLTNCNSGCQWYQQTTQLGYEFRSAASLLVFRRVLRLRVQDPAKEQALNLVQVDAERLYIFAQLSHLPLIAVMVILTTPGYLVHYEGADIAAVAVSVALATVASQGIVMRISTPARRRMQHASDARVAMLAQLVDSFTVLKMYGWTEVLRDRVLGLRVLELRAAARYQLLRAFGSAASYCSPMLSMVAVLTVLYRRGEALSPGRVFLIYTVVGLVRAPLDGMAMGVSVIVDGISAFRRLQAFIAADGTADVFLEAIDGADDKDPGSAGSTSSPSGANGDRSATRAGAEVFRARLSGCFAHHAGGPEGLSGTVADAEHFRLHADFELKEGELVALAGPVASGKSSALLALLGELEPVSGGCGRELTGQVAYLAQPPWIRSGTVREAVVQDLAFDERRYWRAVRSAQMMPDLDAWPAGDDTYVGGRGVTLSGGQRARLGLAHVLYRCLVTQVDLVLLDDCLAALDAHVARGVVEQALLGLIADGRRSVVMVMNSNFLALSATDRVLAASDGRVNCHSGGPSDWLGAAGSDVREVVAQTMGDPRPSDAGDAPPTRLRERGVAHIAHVPAKMARSSALQTLTYYLGAGELVQGRMVLASVFLLMVAVEGLRIYTDHYMGWWAGRPAASDAAHDGFRTYLLLAGSATAAAFLRAFAFVGVALRASWRVHQRLLEQLTSAPVTYFQVMPAGTILNHFSKDLDSLDTLLPQNAYDFAQDIVLLLGVVVVVVASAPPSAVAVAPVLAGFWFVRSFFSKTAREARRLDLNSRGPLYAAVADAADGLATLRAHGLSKGLVAAFADLLDRNGKAFFQTYILQPWCILVLDSLGATIVCITAVSCVLLRGRISPSAACMAISYALLTRGKLQFCVRLSVEAENQLIAVERLQGLSRVLPSEDDSGRGGAVPRGWPSTAAVSFKGVAMRYHPGAQLALRGLDLEVAGGAKVGIVGRTGSGKSSLLAALLRLVELEGGYISIDGVDIRAVPLRDLRGSISVIPQDPVLWSGTLAENLDPTGHASRQHIIDALEAVGMRETAASPSRRVGTTTNKEDASGLDCAVEARGGNFSLGQRQLLCIARAVLQHRRLLLLDEATSSVDGGTDARIQAVLRERFMGVTTLVVAHRVQTVLDADQIVVMDGGRVAEMGRPDEVCPYGSLASLVEGSPGPPSSLSAQPRVCEQPTLLLPPPWRHQRGSCAAKAPTRAYSRAVFLLPNDTLCAAPSSYRCSIQ